MGNLCLRPTSAWTRALRLAVLVLALAAVGTIATRDRTVWETDLRNLSPTPPVLRELDRRLRAQMGAADLRHLLVVRRASMEEVLRVTQDQTETEDAPVEIHAEIPAAEFLSV